MTDRIPYTEPSITELEIRYATDAVTNGWGAQCYDYIHRFENAFKAHLSVNYAIATSSCTGALHMGLAAIGIGHGDEVILADINWVATAAPITYLGATPVVVDILPDTWCIDPARVEEAITSRTKAIIATHLYGNLCAMDELLAIGERHGIPIVEDAAEALGSVYKGKRAGSIGRFGVFSFHGSKTITTGEGGMLVTNDANLYETVTTLADHGRAPRESRQFWPARIGYKYKMVNVAAAIGLAQVERIDELVADKKRIFDDYTNALANTPLTLNPGPTADAQPGYWMVNAIFPEGSMNVDLRNGLIQDLKGIGVDARVFFWPLSSLGLFEPGRPCPIAAAIAPRGLNLPSAALLPTSSIAVVAAALWQSRPSHSPTSIVPRR